MCRYSSGGFYGQAHAEHSEMRKQHHQHAVHTSFSLNPSQYLLSPPLLTGEQRAAAEVVVSVPGVPGRIREGPQNLHEGPRLLIARQTRLPRWSSRTGAQRFMVQLLALQLPASIIRGGGKPATSLQNPAANREHSG